MSNSLELTGKLLHKYDTQHVNDKFKKREFVVELTEEINGNSYTNYAKLQLVQQKCDILDRYAEGEDIVVQFNIKGNRWEKDGKVNFITNLDAWQIRSSGSNTPNRNVDVMNASVPPAQQPAVNPEPQNVDDLPF